MAKSDEDFQLVPPHRHRTNHAEKAIGTFKEHLIASICSYDPSYPMHLWDRNIPQATLTLNLLRPSRIIRVYRPLPPPLLLLETKP